MTRKVCTTALFVAFAISLPVLQQGAVAQGVSGSRTDTSSQGGMMMPAMMQQMEQCRAECRKISDSAEAALTEIRAAKSSDDPKTLHAALDKAEGPLTQMRQHMTNCMSMMDKMQGSGRMQGGMPMDRQQMNEHMGKMPSDTMMTPMDTTMMRK